MPHSGARFAGHSLFQFHLIIPIMTAFKQLRELLARATLRCALCRALFFPIPFNHSNYDCIQTIERAPHPCHIPMRAFQSPLSPTLFHHFNYDCIQTAERAPHPCHIPMCAFQSYNCIQTAETAPHPCHIPVRALQGPRRCTPP